MPRCLWIDAVSVNQNDPEERSNQVMQMGQLYRHAKSVVAWIGESDPATDFCLTLGNALVRTIRDKEKDADLAAIVRWVFGLEDRTPFDDANSKQLQYVSMAWHAIDETLKRPWFRRVWIVQEVALASEVIIHCGKRWIDFQAFYLAIFKSSIFREASKLTVLGGSHGWTSLMGMGRLRGELGGPAAAYPELLHLLSRFTYSEATDDRDRIYSFLGLTHPSAVDEASKSLSPGFVPDYTKPVHQVYLNFALYWMQTHKNLDIFSRIKDRDTKHQGKYHSKLPSWVPDWTHIDGFCPTFIDIQAAEKLPYRASGDELAEVTYNPDLEVLQIKGFVVDTVKIVPDEPIWGKALQDPRHENWAQWNMIALGNPYSVERYGDRGALEAYWRTLVAGCDEDGEPAPDIWEGQIFGWLGLQDCLQVSPRKSNEQPELTSPNMSAREEALEENIAASAALGLSSAEDASEFTWRNQVGFKDRLLKIVNIRSIFITEKGYMGIGPDHVRVGDRIAVLSGGKMPYVLRKKQGVAYTVEPIDGSAADNSDDKVLVIDCHELIDGGECYVHGLMSGEALQDRGGREKKEASLLLV